MRDADAAGIRSITLRERPGLPASEPERLADRLHYYGHPPEDEETRDDASLSLLDRPSPSL